MFFQKIFYELQKRRIRYVVIGGVAVNLHGFQRFTADLDLLIALDASNVQKFVDMIKDLGWKPRAPVPIGDFAQPAKRESWLKEKGMKAFTVYNPQDNLEHLDILIDHPLTFAAAYRNRKVIKMEDVRISVASIDDLIKLKNKTGRGRDVVDVAALKQLKRIKHEKKKV